MIVFQTIQYRISTQFSSIWPIDWTLTGDTTPGQIGPGSDGINHVLHIPQSSSFTRASLSDFLVSYLGHSLKESYPSTEMQSVYPTAPANWAMGSCAWWMVLLMLSSKAWNQVTVCKQLINIKLGKLDKLNFKYQIGILETICVKTNEISHVKR